MAEHRAPSCTPYVVASPLWTRAPSRDENGAPFIDFMMIIPGLKNGDGVYRENCLLRLRDSLRQFENSVAYVDVNYRLNLLWVSVRPVPGITRLIVQAIQLQIPEAKVVAGDFNPPPAKPTNRGWLMTLGRRVSERLRLTRAQSVN